MHKYFSGTQAKQHTTSIGIQCNYDEEVASVTKSITHDSSPSATRYPSDSTHSSASDPDVHDSDPDYKPTTTDWSQERLDNIEDGIFVAQPSVFIHFVAMFFIQLETFCA